MPAGISGAASYHTTQAPPYRIKWVYATGSITRESWTTFDVVRKPAKANLSSVDLRSVAPDLLYLQPISQLGQDWAPQLVRAEMDFALDVRANGGDVDAIVDPEFYDRCVLWRWQLNCLMALWMGSGVKHDAYDTVRTEYINLREKYVGAGNKAHIDAGAEGAIAVNAPGRLWIA